MAADFTEKYAVVPEPIVAVTMMLSKLAEVAFMSMPLMKQKALTVPVVLMEDVKV